MIKNVWISCLLLFFLVGFSTTKSYGSESVAFTLEDRDRIIRMEVMIKDFKEAMDRRFEGVDKHFEGVDKRFGELRQDMNTRFDQMMNFLMILGGIFTTLTLGIIGFAYWDRRTIIKKASAEAIKEIEREGRLKDLILALRELAKNNSEVAQVMRNFHLL